MSYDSEQHHREMNAIERQGEEEPADHSKRLSSYADEAMVAFRQATGETLFPSVLMRCLMHQCAHNGYDVPGSVNGAKFDYAGDKDEDYGWPEWDERTWHTDANIEIKDRRKGFSALADERSGLMILGVWDEDIMEYPRTAIDQYEAQKLADFLTSWIREQRKLKRASFCERVMVAFRRRTASHDTN